MLAAALAGCSREEIKPLTGGTLKLTASVPYFDIETKAGEEFTDEVTAYPLAGTALAADPVLQSYAASGSYFIPFSRAMPRPAHTSSPSPEVPTT